MAIHIERRQFIFALGGAVVAWPLAARAQPQERMRRIGILMSLANDAEGQVRAKAFEQELGKLTRTVSRNFQIDYRWGMNDVERARAATAELLRLAPDVILAHGSPALRAVQQATRTIPIVFVLVSEPVAQGFVQSLAHPGGNITGFTNLEPTVGAKWLGLLKEIAPRVTRVAFIFKPGSLYSGLFYRSIEAAASKFVVEAVIAPVHEPAEIEPIMTTLGREPEGGLIFPPDTFMALHRKLIVELAARYRLPAIYPSRPYVAGGGLVSYGVDIVDQYRQAAAYIDRILRGEKPSDLPAQQPTKFELVINLKTAKALGLQIPDKLLALADEVIE
jgi:putative ABC transport system substrate-binding protein